MHASAEHIDTIVAHLNQTSFEETRAWLRGALEGVVALPLLTPDEPAYLGILRVETRLDKPTRRDLMRACLGLVSEFVQTAQGEAAYLNSLLHLAVKLGLTEIVPMLVALAQRFPELPLPLSQKQGVLSTILDLGVPQPKEFWLQMTALEPIGIAIVALSGLLLVDRPCAITKWAELAEEQPLADAAAIVLEQQANMLSAAERTGFLGQIRSALGHARPLVAASVREWLADIGESDGKRRSSKNYARLDAALSRRPSYRPVPATARLCEVA